LIATAALALGMVAVGASPAFATCAGHFQPGATLTVGGNPVRIPAIDVQVCHVGPTTSMVPVPEVITNPAGTCSTNCFAIVLRSSPISPNTTASVRLELDGTGVDRSQVIPVPGGAMNFCVIGVGFPDPPVSNCFISFDPDF
jgi:hypothetical protein